MKKGKAAPAVGCAVILLLLFSIGGVFAAQCRDINSNGMIDIVDALLTAQYDVGLNPSGFVSANADVNCDGSINIVDALLIPQ